METQKSNTVNQQLVQLSKRYDTVQKERAAMEMKGEDSYHLYQEMLLIEKEMKDLQDKRDSLLSNTQEEIPSYYIEQVTNNGVTYYQLVRSRDEAILYSNVSLTRVADRFIANTMKQPTYKDGSKVVLNK